MKIGIASSMQNVERMLSLKDELNALGHEAFVSPLIVTYAGKKGDEIEETKLYNKNHRDAIRVFWHEMQGLDALLVLNLDKNGIANYIGGNTLMEMGFAHVLNQKIFLYNPVPEISFYKTEIEAMKPTIINGDLSKIV
jgi:hypothetical protein